MLKFFLSAGIVGAFILPLDGALAANCASGQIYRPSRGVCVSRAQAIEAGILGRARHRHVAHATKASRVSEDVARDDETPAEEKTVLEKASRRSMMVANSAPDALAYTDAPVRKPAAFKIRLETPAPATNPAAPRGKSPYGGLVALEPAP